MYRSTRCVFKVCQFDKIFQNIHKGSNALEYLFLCHSVNFGNEMWFWTFCQKINWSKESLSNNLFLWRSRLCFTFCNFRLVGIPVSQNTIPNIRIPYYVQNPLLSSYKRGRTVSVLRICFLELSVGYRYKNWTEKNCAIDKLIYMTEGTFSSYNRNFSQFSLINLISTVLITVYISRHINLIPF